jgi:hypothetical protein
MLATATTIKTERKAFNPANGSSLIMTAREFAQIPHNLDKKISDWAYTPIGEKWGFSNISNVWVRVCETGFKAHFKKNSR